MNARETMEALLAGEEVRPKAESFTLFLDDKGRIMERWDRGQGDTLSRMHLNQECEIEKPKNDPKDILKALAEGRKIHSSCHASYWIDEYGFLYQQWDGYKSPTCLIDVSRCTVEKEERRCRWESYATDAAGWSPASRSPRCSSCLCL